MLKCIYVSEMVAVKTYAFPLMKKKGQMWKSLFWLLLVTPLEQWGVDKWDIVQVTFTYNLEGK